MGALACKILICSQKRQRTGLPLEDKVRAAAAVISEVVTYRDISPLTTPVPDNVKTEIYQMMERQVEECEAATTPHDLKQVRKQHLAELDEVGMKLVEYS